MRMQVALTTPIAATHIQIQIGNEMTGKTIIAEHTRNNRSTMLSILDPSSLVIFIFLAIGPSIISDTPPQQ